MNAKLGNYTTPKMKPTAKSAKGKTDWAALSTLRDKDIITNEDSPATTSDDWTDAIAHRGVSLPARKEQIALRVDADVLSWFRNQGSGWQTRMNAVLKSYRDALLVNTLAVEALSRRKSSIKSSATSRVSRASQSSKVANTSSRKQGKA